MGANLQSTSILVGEMELIRLGLWDGRLGIPDQGQSNPDWLVEWDGQPQSGP